MGLSRRKFTKEMKLAAVQQLETGSSAPKWHGPSKLTRICCTAGARNSDAGRVMLFPVWESGAGMRRK